MSKEVRRQTEKNTILSKNQNSDPNDGQADEKDIQVTHNLETEQETNVNRLNHTDPAYRSHALQKKAISHLISKQHLKNLLAQTEKKKEELNDDTFMDVDEISAADEFPNDRNLLL